MKCCHPPPDCAFEFPKPCAERFTPLTELLRLETAPLPEGRSNEPGRLPPLFAPELFAPEKLRLPPDTAPELPRELLLKKCWDLDGALWNELALPARPDGLKLSREGEIGILPDTKLA